MVYFYTHCNNGVNVRAHGNNSDDITNILLLKYDYCMSMVHIYYKHLKSAVIASPLP